MRNLCQALLILTVFTVKSVLWAEDFRLDSKITQVVGDVLKQSGGDAGHPAQVSESVVPGDLLKTGTDSRAELTSSDQTVFRVGSNSIFSFSDQSRQVILQQGSLLFHTPHGEGGGAIKTAAVTAAVTGSTVMLSTTSNGGAKVVPLESPCIITGPDGRQIARIIPGQLLALIPGAKPLIVSIDLKAFTRTSGLIKNFPKALSPIITQKIDQNVNRQANNIEERTNIILFDTLAINNQQPIRPPPEVQAPQLFDTNSLGTNTSTPNYSINQLFSPAFLSATQNDVNIAPGALGYLNTNVYPTFNVENITASTLGQLASPFLYLDYKYALNTLSTSSTQYENAVLNQLYPNLGVAGLGITNSGVTVTPFTDSSQALIANNVTFTGNYDSDGSDPTPTDLSSVQSAGVFTVIALGNIAFAPTSTANQDIGFVNTPTYLAFGAGGTFTIDGTNVDGGINFYALDAQNLYFGSVGVMTLNYINFYLPYGVTFNIGSSSDVNLNYNNFNLNASGNANATGGGLNITSGGNTNINGCYFNAGNSFNIASSGDVNFTGATTINPATSAAVNISALGNINFTGTTSFNYGASAVITASNSITTQNELTFNSFSSVHMVANTINLQNVNFGYASVLLQSQLGTANFNGTIIAGDVNFLGNVMSAGTTVNAGYMGNITVSAKP